MANQRRGKPDWTMSRCLSSTGSTNTAMSHKTTLTLSASQRKRQSKRVTLLSGDIGGLKNGTTERQREWRVSDDRVRAFDFTGVILQPGVMSRELSAGRTKSPS